MRHAYNHLILGALLLVGLFFYGCAIPVRPIAFVEKDAQGRTHFIPDEGQEPQAADAVSWLAPIIGIIGGPYGEAGLAALTLLLGHHVGHRRGEAKANKKHAGKSVANPALAAAAASNSTVTMP